MTVLRNNHRIDISSFMSIVCSISVTLLLCTFLAHFILRNIYTSFQIYALREVLMTGTAILILLALNTLPKSLSTNETGRATDILIRLTCAIFAGSFIMCAMASASFQITMPLFPTINLGWLFGFAGVSILFHSVARSLRIPPSKIVTDAE